jgi:hypothetical protein
LIADRLSGHDPAAAELASLCAFLAPEPIPEYLFTAAVEVLPGELAALAASPLAWRQTLANVSRQSLARVDHRGLQMHRLTQAILRDRLAPDRAAVTRRCAEAILAASDPGDPPDPGTWTRWAQLMPHLLTADLAATDNPALRELVRRAAWYLIERGDARTARDLMSNLRQQWRDRLGADHLHTLMAGHYLAWALWELGRYDAPMVCQGFPLSDFDGELRSLKVGQDREGPLDCGQALIRSRGQQKGEPGTAGGSFEGQYRLRQPNRGPGRPGG